MARNANAQAGTPGAADVFGKTTEANDSRSGTTQASPRCNGKRGDLTAEIDRIFGGRWPGRLRELFDPWHPKPLALGITRQIVAELGLDEQRARELGRRLGQWTGRVSYLEALAAPGAWRYVQLVEQVSAGHQVAAREHLEVHEKRRRRKAATPACRANAALPILKLSAAVVESVDRALGAEGGR